MDFLNHMAQSVSNTYRATAKQTEKIAKKMKLMAILNENQEKIQSLYEEIGCMVYKKHVQEGMPEEKIVRIEEELMNECSKIDALAEEVKDTRKELLKLKQRKICSNCGQELPLEVKFCPDCGARQTKIQFNEGKNETK